MRTRLTLLATVVTCSLYGTAQAGIFSAQAADITQSPKVVYSSEDGANSSSSSTGNANLQGQSSSGDAIIDYTNTNSNSSSGIFRTRFGVQQQQDAIEYDGRNRSGVIREQDKGSIKAPTVEQKPADGSVFGNRLDRTKDYSTQGQSSSAAPTVTAASDSKGQKADTSKVEDSKVAALEAELAKTKKDLKDTRTRLKNTEETYGVIPVDADGNPLPEAVRQNIPTVPSNVVATAPKYGQQSASAARGRANDQSPVMKVTPGVNQIVTIAIGQPNRLITPFQNPQILTNALTAGQGNECGEVCVKGNVVYISTTKEYPMGLFITDKDNESLAMSLTITPRRIPPREVHLELADSSSVTAMMGSQEAEVFETTQPFVTSVKSTMKAIALGEVPSGYHLQKIPSGYKLPTCSQPGLNFDFKHGQLVAGVNLNYVIGKVKNVSKQTIEFKESTCGGYDVAGVAAYPYNLLRPGESTEVYVVQRVLHRRSNQSVRRSLLQR